MRIRKSLLFYLQTLIFQRSIELLSAEKWSRVLRAGLVLCDLLIYTIENSILRSYDSVVPINNQPVP